MSVSSVTVVLACEVPRVSGVSGVRTCVVGGDVGYPGYVCHGGDVGCPGCV